MEEAEFAAKLARYPRGTVPRTDVRVVAPVAARASPVVPTAPPAREQLLASVRAALLLEYTNARDAEAVLACFAQQLEG